MYNAFLCVLTQITFTCFNALMLNPFAFYNFRVVKYGHLADISSKSKFDINQKIFSEKCEGIN